MEKRLGKKVYRKMPTMQVMTGCLCITVCNDAGVDMGQLLMLSLAVMISLCHADMRLPGYLSWNVSCDGAAIRPYHGRA